MDVPWLSKDAASQTSICDGTETNWPLESTRTCSSQETIGNTIFLGMAYLQMMPKKVGDGFFFNNSLSLGPCGWYSDNRHLVNNRRARADSSVVRGHVFFFSSRSHFGTRYPYEVFSLVFFRWMAQPQTSSLAHFGWAAFSLGGQLRKNTSPFNPSSDHHLDSIIIIIPFGNQRWLENLWKPLKTVENHYSVRWCSSFFPVGLPFFDIPSGCFEISGNHRKPHNFMSILCNR